MEEFNDDRDDYGEYAVDGNITLLLTEKTWVLA
jgi:hypothetical protein